MISFSSYHYDKVDIRSFRKRTKLYY